MINKQNLLRVADCLEHGNGGHEFNMRLHLTCVLGTTARLLGSIPLWCKSAAMENAVVEVFARDHAAELLGLEVGSPTWSFCCAASWSNDPKAAAERLRYAAVHGEAPSLGQWKRFDTAEKRPEAGQQSCPDEVLTRV